MQQHTKVYEPNAGLKKKQYLVGYVLNDRQARIPGLCTVFHGDQSAKIYYRVQKAGEENPSQGHPIFQGVLLSSCGVSYIVPHLLLHR